MSMFIKKDRFEHYIKNFQFRELFNELGWDNVRKEHQVSVNNQLFRLNAVAEKRNFMIFTCKPQDGEKFLDKASRKKIDHAITKLFFEHLIIYIDNEKQKQVWQLCIKEPNKPIVVRETEYYVHQTPELLYQKLKGLFFDLSEEDKIALVDVKQRVTQAFNTNAEKVTKQFYDKFKKEHTAFLGFIEGIDNLVDKEWYASLMLNRLMFIYFIQKKGFLDNNINYLRDKLKETQEKKGKNKFFSFYRDFLLVLFHKGLGRPDHDQQLIKEIGRVPYLNGGLFDVHQIEKSYQHLNIDDQAFERIFEFFDQYNWHLDTRYTATGRDINPDVIGYIFEKYINDRAAMGAYYTKEDITDYISKNTIIPFLFDEVKKHCKNAFDDDSSLWKMLQENPDRYIYDAVKHGVKVGLPENWNELTLNERIAAGVPQEIAVGIDTSQPNLLERRKHWNTPAPPEFALPTEIWREVMERRRRYWEIREKIEQGEIRNINDFITYNLDIKQFAQDAVDQYEGSDFINAFYKAINKITILDPTCGSGAFLFAALNILEPLYETCIDRMKTFVEEDDQKGGKKFNQFRKVLTDIENHPNLKYYIYKSIILNNLYGVDIMNEAVEIAKLRLFLKLVATVDVDYSKDNLGLEPLPDIDFNIRAGNTLVGFAARAFKRFKETQLEGEFKNYESFKNAKNELETRLKKLNSQLNNYLAQHYYGIDLKNSASYENWKQTHLPFHWLVEFYEIIHDNEGFDVIIGNPPYVAYTKKNKQTKRAVSDVYNLINYKTLKCNNLYAFCIERSNILLQNHCRWGMIVPIASISTETMESLNRIYINKFGDMWHSNFATRPGKLFVGVDMNLTISLGIKEKYLKAEKNNFISSYYRWYDGKDGNRESLFDRIFFVCLNIPKSHSNLFPKIGTDIEKEILNKIHIHKLKLKNFLSSKGAFIYYHSGGRYWRKAIEQKISSHYKELKVDANFINIFLCLLNSQFYYWYWITNSNCMDVVTREVFELPIFNVKEKKLIEFNDIKEELIKSYLSNIELRDRNGELIRTTETNFDVKKSRKIINKIDKVLSKHYGFTEEELDFIINYDIKYRMGKELNAGE